MRGSKEVKHGEEAMEFALDKALKEMPIDDEKSVILKNNPQLYSHERNTCSIMGRLLNPEDQKMSSMILDMPSVWRLYSRCMVLHYQMNGSSSSLHRKKIYKPCFELEHKRMMTRVLSRRSGSRTLRRIICLYFRYGYV